MRLVASLVVRDEVGRYLRGCIGHLLEFCDEIRILDDGSTDELADGLAVGAGAERVQVLHRPSSTFFDHEGRIRQALLEWTVAADPDYVLSVDADEFVTDGAMLRTVCERGEHAAFSLCMQEVWNASPGGLETRQDGGWDEHDVTVVWSPRRLSGPLRIADRALACGRVPTTTSWEPAGCGGGALLHFGWANRPERRSRYDRYAVHDQGRFHAGSHIESIMLPDDRVTLTSVPWPAGLERWKEEILLHAGVK